MIDFHGSKLALFLDDQLLVYRRDEDKEIPFPGSWDFPGGGREGAESPEECVLRELYEEFSIKLPPERLLYRRDYAVANRSDLSCFFAAHVSRYEIDGIIFGDEGQYWRLMSIVDFLSDPDGVVNLKDRLRDYLSTVD